MLYDANFYALNLIEYVKSPKQTNGTMNIILFPSQYGKANVAKVESLLGMLKLASNLTIRW
jgi:hypothetical protein